MTEFVQVFNSIFPVFFIIGLGYFLTRIKLVSPEIQKGFNRFAYWVGLPALLFNKCSNASFAASQFGKLFITIMIGIVACVVLAYIIAFFYKMPKPSTGAAVQAAFRGNLAFIALPVIIFTLGPENPIIDIAILTMIGVIIIYNVLSVTLLVYHGEKQNGAGIKDILKEIMINPLIIACVLGLIWKTTPLELNETGALYRITETLGFGAFPMALIGAGSQLAQIELKSQLKWAFSTAVLKSIVCPLIGYIVCRLFAMSNDEIIVALLLMATPTAVASYVLCDQLKCDPGLAASAIFASVIMSFISFSAILLLVN